MIALTLFGVSFVVIFIQCSFLAANLAIIFSRIFSPAGSLRMDFCWIEVAPLPNTPGLPGRSLTLLSGSSVDFKS